jgi:hypothetical protein
MRSDPRALDARVSPRDLIRDLDPAELDRIIADLEERLHEWKLVRAVRRMLRQPEAPSPPVVVTEEQARQALQDDEDETPAVVAVHQAMSMRPGSWTIAELADKTGYVRNTVDLALKKLISRGQAKKLRYGVYAA